MSLKNDLKSAITKLINIGKEWDTKYPSANIKKHLAPLPDLVGRLIDEIVNDVQSVRNSVNSNKKAVDDKLKDIDLVIVTKAELKKTVKELNDKITKVESEANTKIKNLEQRVTNLGG